MNIIYKFNIININKILNVNFKYVFKWELLIYVVI